MAHSAHILFLPHPHNNHRAKILWPQSMVILMGILLMGRSIVTLVSSLNPGVLGYASQINPDKVIELTNNERLNAGLTILKTNDQLNQAALAKAADMFENNYWAHVSPTGVEPWYFITKSGYEYQHAGENLARDFSNPSDVVRAWMASPTHKQNLLDPRYKDIGIAVMDGYINGVETTLVVQEFGATQKTVARIASTSVVNTVYANESVSHPSGLSPMDLNKSWSLAFVVLILIALSLDWIFVLRYNIIRISGKTWAHLTYFIGLAAILLIIRQGFIL